MNSLRRIVGWYLSYLMTGLAATVAGAVFFFVYAAIKTNHVPLGIVAAVLSVQSALVTVMIVLVGWRSLRNSTGEANWARIAELDAQRARKEVIEIEKRTVEETESLRKDIEKLYNDVMERDRKFDMTVRAALGHELGHYFMDWSAVERRKNEILLKYLDSRTAYNQLLYLAILASLGLLINAPLSPAEKKREEEFEGV